jgi:hypothetical protein
MVDEEIKDVSAGPMGAPVHRDARGEPEVIEGKIAGREPDDGVSPPDPIEAETTVDPPRPADVKAAPRRGAGPFLAGALAGLIVSALGVGAGYTFFASKADVSETSDRLGALETQARQTNDAIAAETNRESAAVATLEKRISALESGAGASNAADLGKRVAALETAGAGNGAASDAIQRLTAQTKDLRADVDAEKSELPELSTRVAKLESDAPKANAAAGPELAALAARIDKVEGALAAPKSPEKPAASENATTIAIVAEVAEERLRSGAGFGPELAALQRLGVDSAALAPLEAVVNGAPTNSALAASFDAVAPHVLTAITPAEQGSVADRFLAHLHGLVKVRELNETAGDDPQALVSQIEAASRRGDIGAALASFDKLPEAARKAAGDWPTLARARHGAEAALRSIREAAVGQLAGGPKP